MIEHQHATQATDQSADIVVEVSDTSKDHYLRYVFGAHETTELPEMVAMQLDVMGTEPSFRDRLVLLLRDHPEQNVFVLRLPGHQLIAVSITPNGVERQHKARYRSPHEREMTKPKNPEVAVLYTIGEHMGRFRARAATIEEDLRERLGQQFPELLSDVKSRVVDSSGSGVILDEKFGDVSVRIAYYQDSVQGELSKNAQGSIAAASGQAISGSVPLLHSS